MIKKSGFTIVELLISIAVIGILAAITVASYTNIQRNAQNIQTISNVRSYYDALLVYAAINGEYPVTSAFAVCLGQGYPDGCGESIYASSEDGALISALSSVITSQPPIGFDSIAMPFNDSAHWTGATLTRWDEFTVENIVREYYIQYVLRGAAQDCALPNVVEPSDEGWPNMQPSANGYSWYDTNSNSTMCTVALPAIQ
jgi:prepilin-type N-terminal cleavage/methylation domain-containing protein